MKGKTKEGKQITTRESSKKIKFYGKPAVFYDESGEFAYKGVGLKVRWRWILWLCPKEFCGSNMVSKLNEEGNSNWECMH
jgi:hypothetical protein